MRGGTTTSGRLDARLKWLLGINDLPPDVRRVMVILVAGACEDGVTRDDIHDLCAKTGFGMAIIDDALSYAEFYGLICRIPTSHQRWQLMDGIRPTVSSPRVKEELAERIRAIPGLTDGECILLETVVRIGHTTDLLLQFTYREIHSCLPSFNNQKVRRLTHTLRRKGLLIEVSRGYGDRPFVYRLGPNLNPMVGALPPLEVPGPEGRPSPIGSP